MSRRPIRIGLAPVVSAMATVDEGDDVAGAMLDAASSLLRDVGLRGWTMDDVAASAAVGRTSVYRKFPNRDDLVHAVLARELRRTIAAIRLATDAETAMDDKLVAASLTGLRELRGSLVDHLLRSDPATFLPFVTTGVGPLLAIARDAVAAQIVDAYPEVRVVDARLAAEAAARLGLSLVLTRETVLDLDDEEEAAAAIRRLVRPVLGALSGSR